jgi:uncharacterized repeat protein (TIGR03803 family)
MKKQIGLICAFVVAFAGQAQTNINLTCLVNFIGTINGTNGAMPSGDLTLASDGNFYGLTEVGGTNITSSGGSAGTAYKMTPDGILTTLCSFGFGCGDWPSGSLVQAKDGYFFGTTLHGGPLGGGTVFQMSPEGTLKTVCSSFGDYNEQGGDCTNGWAPNGLYRGIDGNFYGVTCDYGFSGGATIFRITPSGKLAILQTFLGRQSAHPSPPLLFSRNGDLFGTVGGELFRINSNGQFSTNISYNGIIGPLPVAGLIRGRDGFVFGVFTCGAKGGCILKVSGDGKLSTVANIVFTNASFQCPSGELIEASDGNFYGFVYSERTVNGYRQNVSTILRLKPDGKLNSIFEFMGARPNSALVQGKNGKIYGTTAGIGGSDQGTIFCFTPDNSN